MNSATRFSFCRNESPLRARIRPRMAWTSPAFRSALVGTGWFARTPIAAVRAATSRSVRFEPTSPMSGLSSLMRSRHDSMTRTPASVRISGTYWLGSSLRPIDAIRRLSEWRSLYPIWRLVSRSDSGSLMLSRSERFDVQTATNSPGKLSRDFEGVTVPSWSAWRSTFWVPSGSFPISSTRRNPRFACSSFPGSDLKALPRFRGGDGALLERLEEHVLGPERQLPDLVDQEESTVRLQQLSRLEDERAHRVADLLELAQVDVAGQMVGEYLGAALQTGVPVPFPEQHEGGRHLGGVDRGRVESGRVPAGSEPALTDGARGESGRDGRVDDAERVVEHRASVDDPDVLREQVPEVFGEAGLARSRRAEEEHVGSRDERGDQVLVGRIGEHRPGEQSAECLRPVEPLLVEPVQDAEDLPPEPFAGARDGEVGGLELEGGRFGTGNRGRRWFVRHVAPNWVWVM